MSVTKRKITVSREQYNDRKKYLEEKYNQNYITNMINKKLDKLEVEDEPVESKMLIEPVKIDNSENNLKLKERAGLITKKPNKSVSTKNWSIFRSKEYGVYKKQVPASEASYQHFAKLAGYVWSNLSEDEKFDTVENGWGGDWSKVIIK